jgi:hypothetical protein
MSFNRIIGAINPCHLSWNLPPWLGRFLVAPMLFLLAFLVSGSALAQQPWTFKFESGTLQVWNGSAWQTAQSTISLGTCTIAGQMMGTGGEVTVCDGTTRWSMQGTSIGACSKPYQVSINAGTEPVFCSTTGALFSLINYSCTPGNTSSCVISNVTGGRTCLAGGTWGACLPPPTVSVSRAECEQRASNEIDWDVRGSASPTSGTVTVWKGDGSVQYGTATVAIGAYLFSIRISNVTQQCPGSVQVRYTANYQTVTASRTVTLK